MQSSGWVMGSADESERWRERLRRELPPNNEIPLAATLGVVVLAHTEDVAVFLGGARIFRRGLGFTLTAVTREPSPELHGRVDPAQPAVGGILFGVELSDGRRSSTGAGRWPPRAELPAADELILTCSGGGGGDLRVDYEYFLSPVPPDGSMTLYLMWPDLGLDQTSVTVDTTGWAASAASISELWPEPDPGQHEPPPPPAPPAGTWFAQS
jgi:hypothetical protein